MGFYLFLVALGLRFCVCFSLVKETEGHSPLVLLRLLIVVASLVVEHRLNAHKRQ